MPEVPHLMTIDQAAKHLNLHPETLRRAVRAGKLACYKLQGCIRIAPAQLDAYLQENLCPARNRASGLSARADQPLPAKAFRIEQRLRQALTLPGT